MDMFSDGLMEDAPFQSDDAQFSSPNKHMCVDNSTLTPVEEKMADLEAYSSASDFDTSYDDRDQYLQSIPRPLLKLTYSLGHTC